MPKRFTVTEKWNDVWFISLSPQAKVIWEYICDNCDISGVWEANVELMRFRIKFSNQVDIGKHLSELNEVAQKLGMEDRVEWFEDKRRLWIKNFIRVQYGVLSENSSTHRGVIKCIQNHRINKGLPKGFETLIGRVKVKDKNKYNKESKEEKEPNVDFETFWNAYDKKVERDKCEKKWRKLSDSDREAVMAYIPRYKKAQPVKQYRKNPETFLNNRGWEDELISSDSKQNQTPEKVLNEYEELQKRNASKYRVGR